MTLSIAANRVAAQCLLATHKRYAYQCDHHNRQAMAIITMRWRDEDVILYCCVVDKLDAMVITFECIKRT